MGVVILTLLVAVLLDQWVIFWRRQDCSYLLAPSLLVTALVFDVLEHNNNNNNGTSELLLPLDNLLIVTRPLHSESAGDRNILNCPVLDIVGFSLYLQLSIVGIDLARIIYHHQYGVK